MKTIAVIQARMRSTRLPGKVLMPIAGRAMLAHVVERVRLASRVDQVVVACTDVHEDDVIVALCESLAVDVCRGSERDVLERMTHAARAHHADRVVRITADCPLTMPAIIDHVIACHDDHDTVFDYASNTLEPSYPLGTAVEVMAIAALQQACDKAEHPAEREHVTPYLYWRPDAFTIRSVVMEPNLAHLRWTVDTCDDLELARRILQELDGTRQAFELDGVIALLEDHPDWSRINAFVEQKAASEFQQ